MRIAYVTAALPFTSGETYLIPEIRELERRGHDVVLVPVRPHRGSLHSDASSLRALAFGLASPAVVMGALRAFVRSPPRAARALAVVFRSRSLPVLLKNLIVLCKGLWLGDVVRGAEFDHVHAHFGSTPATVALVAGMVSGIPWSFTAHRWDIAEDNLLQAKVRAARAVRTIDVRGRRTLVRLAGCDEESVSVIHMGVPLPAHAAVRPFAGPLRVIIAARLVGVKGHADALEAVSLLRSRGIDVHLDCAGDGPLRRILERRVESLGLSDAVTLLGVVDHADLVERLEAGTWDVGLLPSIETSEEWEGVPVFLVEAMAAGLPVIGTRTGGIPELLDGGTGMLVEQRDPAAIASALARLAACEDLRRDLAMRARSRVKEAFDVEATTASLLTAMSIDASGRASRSCEAALRRAPRS